MRRNLVRLNLESNELKVLDVARIEGCTHITILVNGIDLSDTLKIKELVIDVETEK